MITKDDFLQARNFIFRDLEREIQLAKVEDNALQALGVHSGGGNFLAALGLLCYTEFGGKLRFAYKKRIRGQYVDDCSRNFNEFFDLLGPEYKAFRAQPHNVYDIFRCGLAHEYYVKKSTDIAMLASGEGPAIRFDGCRYKFIVESYFNDLREAFINEIDVDALR